MSIIALITDFGLKDNYVGVIKGVISGINSKAKIIDISHNVSAQDIKQGAFLLFNSYNYFPKGTIFMGIVDPGVGSARKPLAIKTINYYFIGPDNGLLSVAANSDGIKDIRVIENGKYLLKKISTTFHGRDIFAPAAAHLSNKIAFSSLGKKEKNMEIIDISKPNIKNKILEGEVIHIDNFGNLITNIMKEDFIRFIDGKSFEGQIKGKRITKIYSFYSEARQNEVFFIESSFGFMELAVKNGKASSYFSVKKRCKLKVTI